MGERRRLNIGDVIASPVLVGKNDKYMWTGVVRSDNIDPYLINDDKIRERFTKLVREYEGAILEYRRMASGAMGPKLKMNPLSILDLGEQEAKIKELGAKIKEYLGNPDAYDLDFDLFLVQVCRDYEEIKSKNPDEFKAMRKDDRKTLEELYDYISSEPSLREVYNDEENKYYAYMFLTRKQEKLYSKDTQDSTKKLLKVLEAIAGKKDLSKEEGLEILREIGAPITLADLHDIFPCAKYADVQYVTVFKNYLLQKGFTQEEVQNMDPDTIMEEAMKTYNTDSIDFHSSMVADVIVNGIKYIDVEKLMLLSCIRTIEAYDMMLPKVEDHEKAAEIDLDAIREMEELEKGAEELSDKFIRQEASIDSVLEKTRRSDFIIRKIIESGVISPKTRFTSRLDDKGEISLRVLEKKCEKFCDGIYLTDIIKSNLIYKAFINPDEMSTWSDELMDRMSFTENDIKILSLISFDNMKRFYETGRLSFDSIGDFLGTSGSREKASRSIIESEDEMEANRREVMLTNADNVLINLYKSGITSTEDLRYYFQGAAIDAKDIIKLEESLEGDELAKFKEEMKEHFDSELLLESYKEYVEKYLEFKDFEEKNPDNIEEIEAKRKSLNKMRLVKEETRSLFARYTEVPEDKKEFGNDLLDMYYVGMGIEDDKMLRETLKLLYEDGLIGLENIAYLEPKYIRPMFDKLSLDDAMKVKQSMSFETLTEMFDDIFIDPEFTDERRFIAVMNFFGDDTKEDGDAREFYLGMLENDAKEKKARPSGKKREKGDNTYAPGNKYVYPDFVKWKFYKAIDKDCRVTRYANGFVEFASSKLGARIIEKYYDGDKPAYGTATYILSEQDYRMNEGDLITIGHSGDVMESSVLREITPRKDRIAHRTQSENRTWMHDMIRHFGIDLEKMQDSRYSQEELKELQTVLERYKTEYELLA